MATLTSEDFARGFVLTHIGTNEVHDFNVLEGAIINSDWLALGAAKDWFYLEEMRGRMFSRAEETISNFCPSIIIGAKNDII